MLLKKSERYRKDRSSRMVSHCARAGIVAGIHENEECIEESYGQCRAGNEAVCNDK